MHLVRETIRLDLIKVSRSLRQMQSLIGHKMSPTDSAGYRRINFVPSVGGLDTVNIYIK